MCTEKMSIGGFITNGSTLYNGYWSSTTVSGVSNKHYMISYYGCGASSEYNSDHFRVRPIRVEN